MAQRMDSQVVLGFVEEVRGYLPQLRKCLSTYAGDPGNRSALGEAYRYVHNIRGAASMIGLGALGRVAGGIEDELEAAHEGRRELDADTLSRLTRSLIYIETAVAGVRTQPSLAAGPAAETGNGDPVSDLPAEILADFRLEAGQHLDELSRLFDQMQRQPENREPLQEIQRRVHNLKGTAGTVGFGTISSLTHRMEDLLAAVDEGRLNLGPDECRAHLLRATDAIGELLRDSSSTRAAQLVAKAEDGYARLLGPLPEDVQRQFQLSATPTEPGPAAEDGTAGTHKPPAVPAVHETIRVPLPGLDRMAGLVTELFTSRTGFEQQLEGLTQQAGELETGIGRLKSLAERLDRSSEESGPSHGVAARSLPRQPQDLSPSRAGFDDLELDHYSELHILSRNLAELTADLNTVSADVRGSLRQLAGQVDRQRKLTSQAQEQLLKLRMVPFSSLVPRLERAVRLTAENQGKQVRLEVVGEEVELDKLVLEEITDSLLHLIRNAVVHGIESPWLRGFAGKAVEGRVTIRLAHEGHLVVLRVEDDGAGLDTALIVATALRQGRLTEEELGQITEDDVAGLILRSGFSTAPKVGEASGRGVGLDVVEQVAQKLMGKLVVGSRAGAGAHFTLRLPMTLAIDRVLLATAQGRTVALPESSVERILRLAPEDLMGSNGKRHIQLGGKSCALFALCDLLGPAGGSDTAGSGAPWRKSGPFPAFVVRTGPRPVAVAVDRLLGAREVVVKDLGSHLKQVPGVRGATLMGDGGVVLILDPPELVRTRGVRTVARRPVVSTPARPTVDVLVVDDSLSVRRVLSNTLRRAGWNPVVARDGLEALGLLQQSQRLPGVILADIEMPRMDGYELTSTLKALEEFRRIPIVMLTSRAGEKHRQRAFEVGASNYLVKPYQEEELVSTVRRLLP